MKDTAAIIVAGGKGLRFGGKIRKQYLRLNGRPILWWSLNAFQRSPSVDAIVLVVPSDDIAAIRKISGLSKISKLQKVVAGGKTRQESVQHGLSALDPHIRWVAVHDAVRPCVSHAVIDAVFTAAAKDGAAMPGIK